MEQKQTHFSSGDYAQEYLKGSELDEKEGIEFVYAECVTQFSEKFKKNFYNVLGSKDGEPVSLTFSSGKLAQLFKEHGAEFAGKKIRIRGNGIQGVKREYDVDLLE